MSQHLDVIISSTADDLREYRAAVRDAILSFGLYPIMMEAFPSEDRTAVEVCRREVERAEILIGIYAHRYGWVPKPEDGGDGTSSITALEYQWAGERGIPRLCFLVDPGHPWLHTPPHVDEDPAKLVLLEQFKQRVSSKIRTTFTTPQDLASKVKDALRRAVQDLTGAAPQETQWRAPQPPGISADRRFVGRTRDIDAVRALLQPGATVSITASVAGAGGIGKTYLAYHLANVLKDEFRGGTLLVTLGPDAQPKTRPGDLGYEDELKRVVESVVNRALPDWAQAHPDGRRMLAADPGAISPDKVKGWLAQAPGRLLVILDDVWHDAPARALRNLLPDGTAVLVTTRNRALNLGRIYDLDKLSPEDARAMLTDRLSYLGDLEPHIARLDELVVRLGGHALALEIAAANVAINGLMHLPQYLADIESAMNTVSPFEDLTLDYGDTAREKSVEVALAYSYDPLPETLQARFRALGAFPQELDYDERAVFAVWDVPRVSVPPDASLWKQFAAPFDPAAEKAARDDLLALYQRGLVRRDDKGRYRQHALMRVYAEALARRAEEWDDNRARYVFYMIYGVVGKFSELPREAWEKAIMPDQEHIHLMGNTLANELQRLLGSRSLESLAQPITAKDMVLIRAAVGAIQELPSLRLSEDFAAVASKYVLHRRVGEDGRRWLWMGLVCARLRENKDREKLFVGQLALWHDDRGQKQAALDYNQTTLLICQSLGDRWNEATALNNIGAVYRAIGQPQRALEHYDRALPIRREVGDRAGEAATLNNLANVYYDIKDPQRALQYFEQALPILREVGDRAGEGSVLNNIGGLYNSLKDPQKALEYLQQALPIRREVGDRAGEATTLNNMGFSYWLQGDPDRTVTMMRQVIQVYHDVGAVAAEAASLFNLAVALHQALGQTAEAIELVTRSIAILEQYQLPQDHAGTTLEQHRTFLATMRGEAPPNQTQAIVEAIAAFVQTPDWDAARAQLEQRAELLLRPDADAVFQAIIDNMPGDTPPQAIEVLRQHRAILARCRIYGIAETFRQLAAGDARSPARSPQDQDSEKAMLAILEAIAAFVQTPNWEAAKVQVEQHADLLLRPDADDVFQVLIDNAPEGTPPEAIKMMEQHRAVLALCREHGIEEAFRRLSGGG